MDEERLKNGGSILTKDYFEKQLQKIREIRMSERRFYQKVTDIYATSVDYDPTATATKKYFTDGNAKFISYMNVYSNLALDVNMPDRVKVGDNERQNKVQLGDVLFTGSSENTEECGMSSVLTTETQEPLYLNSFCFGYRFNDTSMFLPDFSKFLFRSDSLRKQIIRTASEQLWKEKHAIHISLIQKLCVFPL